MTTSERERVEREARKIVSEHCGAHPARLTAVVALILRERAAAFDQAELIARGSQSANAGDVLAKPFSAHVYGWGNQTASYIADKIAALAAQERAHAGEGGGA